MLNVADFGGETCICGSTHLLYGDDDDDDDDDDVDDDDDDDDDDGDDVMSVWSLAVTNSTMFTSLYTFVYCAYLYIHSSFIDIYMFSIFQIISV